ncbi:hypothetical protein KIPB_003045 [Kipferlia bialata]|uniref:SH3 domain-containing protein n=1 Tax=Kipferlia bialata TaxID=797122 RepID=A0A9K3GH50_9EUKA|nr:hypothetical protein KIPB_003045 [Kipferlia bialata]|eukprot:g3045.t1
MHTLCLNGCGLSDVSSLPLARVLHSVPSIKALHVGGNRLSVGGVDTLVSAALAAGPRLMLSVSGPGISGADRDHLLSEMRRAGVRGSVFSTPGTPMVTGGELQGERDRSVSLVRSPLSASVTAEQRQRSPVYDTTTSNAAPRPQLVHRHSIPNFNASPTAGSVSMGRYNQTPMAAPAAQASFAHTHTALPPLGPSRGMGSFAMTERQSLASMERETEREREAEGGATFTASELKAILDNQRRDILESIRTESAAAHSPEQASARPGPGPASPDTRDRERERERLSQSSRRRRAPPPLPSQPVVLSGGDSREYPPKGMAVDRRDSSMSMAVAARTAEPVVMAEMLRPGEIEDGQRQREREAEREDEGLSRTIDLGVRERERGPNMGEMTLQEVEVVMPEERERGTPPPVTSASPSTVPKAQAQAHPSLAATMQPVRQVELREEAPAPVPAEPSYTPDTVTYGGVPGGVETGVEGEREREEAEMAMAQLPDESESDGAYAPSEPHVSPSAVYPMGIPPVDQPTPDTAKKVDRAITKGEAVYLLKLRTGTAAKDFIRLVATLSLRGVEAHKRRRFGGKGEPVFSFPLGSALSLDPMPSDPKRFRVKPPQGDAVVLSCHKGEKSLVLCTLVRFMGRWNDMFATQPQPSSAPITTPGSSVPHHMASVIVEEEEYEPTEQDAMSEADAYYVHTPYVARAHSALSRPQFEGQAEGESAHSEEGEEEGDSPAPPMMAPESEGEEAEAEAEGVVPGAQAVEASEEEEYYPEEEVEEVELVPGMRCRCIDDFTYEDDRMLDLVAGDVVEIVSLQGGWVSGTKTNQYGETLTGFFPPSYVEPI